MWAVEFSCLNVVETIIEADPSIDSVDSVWKCFIIIFATSVMSLNAFYRMVGQYLCMLRGRVMLHAYECCF